MLPNLVNPIVRVLGERDIGLRDISPPNYHPVTTNAVQQLPTQPLVTIAFPPHFAPGVSAATPKKFLSHTFCLSLTPFSSRGLVLTSSPPRGSIFIVINTAAQDNVNQFGMSDKTKKAYGIYTDGGRQLLHSLLDERVKMEFKDSIPLNEELRAHAFDPVPNRWSSYALLLYTGRKCCGNGTRQCGKSTDEGIYSAWAKLWTKAYVYNRSLKSSSSRPSRDRHVLSFEAMVGVYDHPSRSALGARRLAVPPHRPKRRHPPQIAYLSRNGSASGWVVSPESVDVVVKYLAQGTWDPVEKSFGTSAHQLPILSCCLMPRKVEGGTRGQIQAQLVVREAVVLETFLEGASVFPDAKASPYDVKIWVPAKVVPAWAHKIRAPNRHQARGAKRLPIPAKVKEGSTRMPSKVITEAATSSSQTHHSDTEWFDPTGNLLADLKQLDAHVDEQG
ncbi:hypothetical protein FA13DRAFT_1711577 [Coprinellus micaceus]|uniref:Uncharacterized protein n=1 Tax=Coprinellus micaceus TaxID=71717 RepID=A0A4Y7T3Y5_COPMI|nr:hypothetical protein FA13DRAFT_1711577 [Coprinellus micaceus]